MPLVFVHGVNVRREDKDFDSSVQRIRAYLLGILAKSIGLESAKESTYFPYWGGNGVSFRWNQASLPDETDAVESLHLKHRGPDSSDSELWLGEARFQYGPLKVSLGKLCRERKDGFEEAVDLIWDTASAVLTTL